MLIQLYRSAARRHGWPTVKRRESHHNLWQFLARHGSRVDYRWWGSEWLKQSVSLLAGIGPIFRVAHNFFGAAVADECPAMGHWRAHAGPQEESSPRIARERGICNLRERLWKKRVDGSGVNAPESGIGLNTDERFQNNLTDLAVGCRAPCETC